VFPDVTGRLELDFRLQQELSLILIPASASILLGLPSDDEEGSDMLRLNVGEFLPNSMALQPRILRFPMQKNPWLHNFVLCAV
jgi:hypothetical protein